MKRKILIFCVFTIVLLGCSESEQKESDEKVKAGSIVPVNAENLLPKKIADVLKGNLPEIQEFAIESDEFNVLETKNGAIINIPPDAFEGNPTDVILKVKEIFSIKDIVFSGMQTVSDKGWLLTSGMIYLQAFSDDKEVFFKKGKSAVVNIPTDNFSLDATNKLFEGVKSENGIEWKETNDNNLLDFIIPFPINYLQNDMIDYYASDLEQYHDRILTYIVDPSLKNVSEVSQYNWWKYESLEKYKNSLIVTREFNSMFNGTSGIADHHEMVDFYFQRNELPLWKIDSMYWPEYEYKDRKNGKVIKLDYDGLDLNNDGYEKLIKQGLTEENAFLTMSYYETRKNLMKKMDKDPEERFAAQFNTMLINRMGWINIDKYLDSDKEPISLKITVLETSENTMVYLVDKKNKLVLRANRNGNVFFFGKDENEKLPIPDYCTVYTFDANNGLFYFQETYLEEGDQEYEVLMESVEKNNISDFIKSKLE